MSEATETTESAPQNVYEENLNPDTTLDLSNQDLDSVPQLNNFSLVVLYLQNNNITSLPADFFTDLKYLMYLDLRDNSLTEIPESIKHHTSLTHLLLQNNCLKYLPNEIGTVKLKVLQIKGNPLEYPPLDVLHGGTAKILKYLKERYLEDSKFSSETTSVDAKALELDAESLSYNSVLLDEELNKLRVNLDPKDGEEEYYKKISKCTRLGKSRYRSLPPYSQSSKYLKPLRSQSPKTREEKIRETYLRDIALTKKKELLDTQEKILQHKRNIEMLRNWRKGYRYRQCFTNPSYKLEAKNYPYDTSPEYMTFLTREDIEKDLPDKYRKHIMRRCKPTVPRKRQNDVHLAMKIKQLFENLEAIDLNRDTMTPRTEQKFLLNEIHKISEIKQKLHELSTTNIGTA